MHKNLTQQISTWLLLVVALLGFKAQAYDEMYLIGSMGGWNLSNHIAMTKSGDVFTYTGNFPDNGDGYCWFAFTSSSSTDWGTVNNNRFGPSSNGTVATVGSNNVNGTGDVSFKIAAGNYSFSFDTNAKTLTVATATVETNYYLAGSFTNPSWGDGKLQMTKSGNSYSVTVPNITSGAQFKIIKEVGGNLTWLGGSTNDETYGVHSGWCTDIPLSENSKNFQITGTGNLTFTVTNDQLTVTGWGALESSLTLVGSFDNWGAGEAMTKNGDGSFTITKTLAAESKFKFKDQYGNWKGVVSEGDYWVTEEMMQGGSCEINMETSGEGQDVYFVVAGTWTITVNAALTKVTISGTWVNPECPVVVKSGITHGTVAVDKNTARAGETVTITVTPAAGYYAENANDHITVEKTMNAGSAQAPPRKAAAQIGLGEFVTVSGTDIASAGEATTYTFVMPAAPSGALVNVEFQECTPLTADMFNAIADQNWTGSQITPEVTPTQASGLTSDDYDVAYGTNTDEGTGAGTVTVTGKGKYTSTVNLPFNITGPAALYLVGSFNEWTSNDANYALTKQANNTWTLTKQMPAGIEFKVRDNLGNWYSSEIADTKDGQKDMYWITSEQLGEPLNLSREDGKANFYINFAGEWTFTVNAARTTLTVSGAYDYAVDVASEVASYITPDKQRATAGEQVSFTVSNTPAYAVENITVTDANNNPVTVNNNEGTYTFTMPYANVTISGTLRYLDLYLSGSFNSWIGSPGVDLDNDYKFAVQQDGSLTLTKQLPKEITFKVVDVLGTWRGAAGEYDINETQVTNPDNLDLGGEYNFSLPVAGEWTFTVNAARDKLTITGPWGYTVTADAASAAYVNAPSEKQFPNETVTFTVNAQQGKAVSYVVASYGSEVLPLTNDNGTYSFTMPYANVTITAFFDNTKYKLTLGEGITADVANVNEVLAGTPVTITVTVSNPADFKAASLVLVATAQDVDNPVATENADGTFTFSMPMSDVTVSAVVEAILHGVAFDSNRHWATYYGAYNLQVPEGVTAYIATGLNAAGDAVEVQSVDYIPAATGVLLSCQNEMKDITTPLYTDALGTVDKGVLAGSLTATDITGGYVLYQDKFLRAEAGELPAHRCYLPAAQVPQGAPRLLTIRVPAIVVTGIEGVDASNVKSVKYINLQGITSDKPFQGLNIKVITMTDGSVKAVKVIK